MTYPMAREGGEIQATSPSRWTNARLCARHSLGTGARRGPDASRLQPLTASVSSNAPLARLLALLWLAGIATRLTILAIPPVIPLIRDELQMTEAQVGFLVALPVLMFALAAVPGSLLVARLGTILRDAENATASAFRTSLMQIVDTDTVSNGAIAAPLVSPAGCVGVMAAEVRHEGEKDSGKLAAATIVAAQLATLVGPPSTRAQPRADAV